MPINVNCPSCSRPLAAPDKAAGRRAKCPNCGNPVEIPCLDAGDEEDIQLVLLPDEAEKDPAQQEDSQAQPQAASGQEAAPMDDKVRVPCPGCGKRLKARPSLAGGVAKCPRCGRAVQIPAKILPGQPEDEIVLVLAEAEEEEFQLLPLPDERKKAAPAPAKARAPATAAAPAAASSVLVPKLASSGFSPVLVAKSAPASRAAKTPEPLRMPCPTCGKVVLVPAMSAGHDVKCPGCGQPIHVPAQVYEAEEVLSGDELQEIPATPMYPQGPTAAATPMSVLTAVPVAGTLPMPTAAYPAAVVNPSAMGYPPAVVPVAAYPAAVVDPSAAAYPLAAGVGTAPVPLYPALAGIYTDDDFAPAPSATSSDTSSGSSGGDVGRHPCPKCGEMITDTAAKCRFCGAIFDEHLERAKNRKKRRSQDKSGMSTLVGGLVTMLASLIWFFVGLFFGYIFFYPPILFLIGLFAFFKGLVQAVRGR